jgi:hypothetical protein
MDSGIFRKTLGRWAEKVDHGLDGLARVSCQDLAEAVIDGTRIDTGFLVGNWQPSLNAPVLMQTPDLGPGAAGSKLGVVISQIKAGDHFFYVNNAAYAMRMEYGFVGTDALGRTYNQAGDHNVTINIQRWPRIVDGAARKLGIAA